MNLIRTIFNGFCMAMADSVPGVSGGTIAFILGFYDRFLWSLQAVFGKSNADRKAALKWLVKLGIGWIVGMVLAMSALSNLFNTKIYLMSSIFLGLTFASIPFVVISEKPAVRATGKRPWYLVFLLFGIVLVAALTYFRVNLSDAATIDFLGLGLFQFIYLILAGMAAITAMVLPGISGSMILLIFGVYAPAVTAINGLIHGAVANLPGILCLVLGAILSVILIIRGIRYLLAHFRPQMICFIVGMLIGSLYAIVMGPISIDAANVPLSMANFSWIGFIVGIGILVGLEMLYRKMGGKAGDDEGDPNMPAETL